MYSLPKMSLVEELDYESDNEIFFGKVTLKEIKKHVFMNKLGQFTENKKHQNIKPEPNASINIIEAHSQPNLRATKQEKATFYSNPSSPALNGETADDSFLKLESMVSELCVEPRTSDNIELNNTLEVIDYILNNGPNFKIEHKTPKKENVGGEKLPSIIIQECTHNGEEINLPILTEFQETNPVDQENKDIKLNIEHIQDLELNCNNGKLLSNIQENTNIDGKQNKSLLTDFILKNMAPMEQQKTPHKDVEPNKAQIEHSGQCFSSAAKIEKKLISTPSSSSLKLKAPVFKTPSPMFNKKTVTSAKKTPSRSNAYQHIASPIASYIKNCPQVPLVKDVHPRKPLPGTSAIPKLVKSQPIQSQLQNKENIDLPKIAYKSAKKTVLINVDEQKLPQSQWAKSLPSPKVVKHEKREMNPLKFRNQSRQTKQEESFANLSYLQAEVSVCTQKTAFKSNN